MLMEKERKELVEYGKKLCEIGLMVGTSGNVSVYDPETGYMAISPSGLDYYETKPEDIVIMDLKGNIIEGDRKPSSEHGLHTIMYTADPKNRAVVHTHSKYCTTIACMGEPIRAVHYAIGVAEVATVPCAEYATYGSMELAHNVEKVIKETGSRAAILANHGLVTGGATLEAAMAVAINVEFVAELQWRTMCAGKPVIIDDEEMARVMEKFKTYGQK